MRRYPGKIILFGEYTVIDNGHALAMPLKSIFGSIKFKDSLNTNSNAHLKKFSEFLQSLKLPYGVLLDLEKMNSDITNGLIIESNAKAGYGIGSSGIVTAALFERYFIGKYKITLSQLKGVLSLMESFFHGKSSGLDPLVSFINSPLMVSDKKITILDKLPASILNDLYLLDTGISRSTQPLVKWFRNKMEGDEFRKAMNEMGRYVDLIIEDLLLEDKSSFEQRLYSISKLQLKWWKRLIPDHLKDFWKDGLKNRTYCTKICGAGGGGYLLVYKLKKSAELDVELSAVI